MKNQRFTIVTEKDSDGYFAYCPQLQGCHAQGETYEEAMSNIEDVIKLHLQDRMEEKETWKSPGSPENLVEKVHP